MQKLNKNKEKSQNKNKNHFFLITRLSSKEKNTLSSTITISNISLMTMMVSLIAINNAFLKYL